MIKKIKNLALAAGAAAGLGACVFPMGAGFGDEQEDTPWRFSGETLSHRGSFTPTLLSGNVEVVDAVLTGAIGPLAGINDAAIEVNGWESGNYTEITITTHNADGAAMTIVDIYGGLDHPDLQPGLVADYDPDFWGDNNTLGVTVTGCSGPQPGSWDYDQPSDDVDVDVREDPNDPQLLMLNFRARTPADYSGYSVDEEPRYVFGTLTLRRPQADGGTQAP
jgi:hypothetical protein